MPTGSLNMPCGIRCHADALMKGVAACSVWGYTHVGVGDQCRVVWVCREHSGAHIHTMHVAALSAAGFHTACMHNAQRHAARLAQVCCGWGLEIARWYQIGRLECGVQPADIHCQAAVAHRTHLAAKA
jgi:hypothetical protein